MAIIKDIRGIELLDSRGNPTVAATVTLEGGATGFASVPSGASTGSREAVELRDKDRRRYIGKGVLRAVGHVNNELRQALAGHDAADQSARDRQMLELDGSGNLSRLGSNAVLAVSLAIAKAQAAHDGMALYRAVAGSAGTPALPVPMMNIVNGGAHADNNIDIQEFMILPVGAASFSEALQFGAEIFHALKADLKSRGLATSVGDEGGFAPNLASNEAALEAILSAIRVVGLEAGKDIWLGLDVASSEFHHDDRYHLSADAKSYSSAEFVAYLARLADNFPILSIEDGMAEDDWAGWAMLSERLGKRVQLVGDDLFVTHTEILRRGIDEGIANAILIKPNQIGTLSQTLAAIAMASDAGYASVISHRSGETEDVTIADLAVATSASQIKTGSLCRSERTAKYNRLLMIEQELGDKALYAGRSAFPAAVAGTLGH